MQNFQDWETVVLKKETKSQGQISSHSHSEIVNKDKDKVTLKEPSLDFQKALQQARLVNKMSQKDLINLQKLKHIFYLFSYKLFYKFQRIFHFH